MTVLGVVVAGLFLLLFLLFSVGAVVLGMERSRDRYRAGAESRREEAVDAFLQKEEDLAKRDADAILRDAPRAEEHGKRTEELAEGARTRIRNRARSVLSGNGGSGAPAGG